MGECEGQPPGEPSCDEKIVYWNRRWLEACEQKANQAVLLAALALEADVVMTMLRSHGRDEDSPLMQAVRAYEQVRKAVDGSAPSLELKEGRFDG